MRIATTRHRIRRSRDESRELILAAAEQLLRESGPEAVNVRAVAARVGLTDAAVNHHFGTRDELLETLLRHAGRRLKDALDAAAVQWKETGASVRQLVDIMADLYSDGAYAELALRLYLSGWRDRGSGMLADIVAALHDQRSKAFAAAEKVEPSMAETQFIVGLLHQTLALDPLFGAAFRRSTGAKRFEEPTRERKKQAWTAMFEAMLSGELSLVGIAEPAQHHRSDA
jgi:AcrR family transcriptional regulator